MEKLKKRAQRFGSAGGSSVINKVSCVKMLYIIIIDLIFKMEVTEKKKARATRFNLSAVDFTVEVRIEIVILLIIMTMIG